MNFISWAFVILIIPVFLARLLIGRQKTERPFVWLTMVVSTVFVMWHVPIYIFVMLVSITVDYVAALLIEGSPANAHRRKLFLVASMATNLAILGFFKYTDFAAMEMEKVLGHLHFHVQAFRLGLVLPMGISFYTFGSMSYTVDVYRGKLKAVRRYQDFYYFVTFFPHLVAGPIIRAEQFFYQFARTRRPWLRTFNGGCFLIIRGLFLKMVCADNISGVVAKRWADAYIGKANSGSLLLLAVLFAIQIFADFEGYSSIARGLAYLMGFRFPINFDNPYIASSFSNFWERWHITLSRWLRDYLYIPLGGNRGTRPRTYFNLMAVMILGGLWHGAAMTFVIWGFLHGAALAVERMLGLSRIDKNVWWPFRFSWYLVVQATVLVTWILFRSGSAGQALLFIRRIGQMHLGMPEISLLRALLFCAPVVVMHLFGLLIEKRKARPLEPIERAMLAGLMLFAVLSAYGASSEFIYFQF